ncbi:MFS transporter [Dactylosporangium sp. CA-139066]|uniref:MFS transporter n=1 Tax=Dactylosporangium sp. CA-139066 TaxID=3239930 RepID=UPI003D90C503
MSPRRALVVVALVDSAGTGLYLAGSTVFLIRSAGLSAAAIGTGLAVSGAAGLLASVPLGTLTDRWGARRMLAGVQAWRALWFTALAFVDGPTTFVLVSLLLGLVERTASPATQAVVAAAVPGHERTRTLALMRSVRNAGFSLGALAAAPLLAAHSVAAYRTVILADAASFAAVVFLLARLRVDTAPSPVRRGPLTFLADFRDWRYLRLAGLNGLLYLHTTILTVALPMWTLLATPAPVAVVPLLVGLNTVLTVAFQVPFSSGVDSAAGTTRALRRAGLALALCCAAFAAAAQVGRTASVALLVLGTVLLTAGELWQSAAAWEASYRYAPEHRKAEYLAVFGLGPAAQEIVGPPLVTLLVMGLAGPGWVVLAGLLAAVVPVVPRAVGDLALQEG